MVNPRSTAADWTILCAAAPLSINKQLGSLLLTVPILPHNVVTDIVILPGNVIYGAK